MMLHRLRGPLVTAVSLVGLLVTAGCASSNVNGRDKDAVFPTLRAVFDLEDLSAGAESAAEVESSRPRRFRQGLEVEVGGTFGEFVLDTGIGKTDYRALHGSVAYRFGIAAPRVQFFGLVGVGADRVELSGNPMASLEESYFGPMFGFEGRVRLRDWVSPYVRLTGFLMEEGSSSSQFESGLLFTTFERADLFVAFRRWEAEYGNAAPASRDLEVDWSGVVIGCSLRL